MLNKLLIKLSLACFFLRAQSRRTSREDRLRALGFESPSDDQRREQLARNVASLQQSGQWD